MGTPTTGPATGPMTRPMTGRTVLVTGATGGIGLATARRLAGLGARVGIVGRDETRAAAAAGRLRDGGAEVGVFLTDLLLDRLRASAPARVVTVSSGAQAMGRIDLDDLQGAQGYNGQRAYNQSKLANVMFTYELARRLGGSGVTANALHPGVVRTAFGQEDSGRWMRLMLPVVRPCMKSPERGADTSVLLASSPELEHVAGSYFAGGEVKRSSRASYDTDVAARLWRISAELVGLDPS